MNDNDNNNNNQICIAP